MNLDEIMKLPISKLLSDDAFVLVWCTNKYHLIEQFKERLVEWNLEPVTTWHWLKVRLKFNLCFI